MVVTKYSSLTLGSANQGAGDGVPATNSFDNVGVSDRLFADSSGAYTQSVLYYLTGNPVYRENAMKIIRIWSHMDPTKYKFFADAQIKTGPFVYRLIAAAELLRYTSALPTADGYNTAWTDQDTADFSANFAVPAVQTFNYGNAWYMNQGTLPLLGAMASYIFADNRARYNEGVEWFTVNSTAPDQDVNGALSSMYRLIDKSDPRNPYGKTFINHIEMGRDQAHAGDDVLTLTTLARIVNTQKTLLDPSTGTVSTKKNAVDPYTFMGNRLLAGSNAFVGFMMGYSVPWIDITQQGGSLAQSYRGRWNNSLNELYHIYQDVEHVDVAKVAPYIAQQYEQRDGPLYYNFNVNEVGTAVGTDGLQSFWGGTLTGDDYWLSLPNAAKGESEPAPQKNVSFVQKASVISGKATTVTEGDRTFLSTQVKAKPAVIAVRTMQYGARTGYSPVAIEVRTNSLSTLDVRRTAESAPYTTITVPNTNGKWRTITYDLNTSVVPLAAMGDNNIVYYSFTGAKGTVDLDYVIPNAASTVTPPVFPQGYSTTLVGVQGAQLSVDYSAKDSSATDTVGYSLSEAPKGAVVNQATGAFLWTPTAKQVGDNTVVVQADDGSTDTALNVRARIAADRNGAIALAQDGYDSSTTYTTVSKAPFDAAVADAKSVAASGSDAAFLAAVAKVQTAVTQLQLLNPRLSDGTLDYRAIATSSLGSQTLANLVDNDSYTFSGDLSVTSFTVDFGSGYRVEASAFGIQARQTFGNRSQGSNVYGSNDNVTWTKLTTTMTTNTNDMETLPVDPSLAGKNFRFFKVQVDQPGAPTDPNFPGIFSVAEFHIHGDRVEAVDRIATATITANDPVPGIATNGDIVTVAFTTTEPVTNVSGTIEGAQATVSGGGTSWTASAVLPDTIPSGQYAAFSIGYTTADGRTADPLVVSTDGSKLFLSNSAGLVTNVPGTTTTVGPDGEVEASKVPFVAKMFDNNATTFSDVGPVNGQYYITLDFGEGGSLALDHADLLVRQDNNGTSRAPNLHIEGSNDQSTWAVVTNNAKSTLDWQAWGLRPGTTPTAYRYLRIVNTNWINIAELRLFGTRVPPLASSVVAAHIGSTGPVAGRAVKGDTVNVDFTTSEAITNVSGTIDGKTATITGSRTSWHASLALAYDSQPGRKLPFRIQYTGTAREARQALVRSTDGSTVFLSSDVNLIQNAATAPVISPTGAAEPAKQAYVNKMFDNNSTTFSDIGPVNGQYYVIFDFGAGHAVMLDHADLLVRQDNNGTARASNLHLEGSNDLSTWTRVTNNAVGALPWQNLATPTGATATGYRYLKIANTDWINIAELRLFGIAG
ncbi:discoidin domain-containing protein [Leifsonia sp. NPDC014704]|uniref:discoidin domain-containing protein n=1 Tax=Leifsonia sp. NPDC014704 TaxID=3364123 RepID=UPI0036F46D17